MINDTVRFLNGIDLVSRAEIKNLLTKVSVKTQNIARNKAFEKNENKYGWYSNG